MEGWLVEESNIHLNIKAAQMSGFPKYIKNLGMHMNNCHRKLRMLHFLKLHFHISDFHVI